MACRYTYQGKTYEAHEFDDVLRALSPMEAAKFMPGVESVPSAPFVGRTDAWVALSLKRMIRYAAENGFDRVAWTNGEQQAARYDLSKHVDKLVVYDDNTVAGFQNGRNVITQPFKDESGLADIVGKEVAKKLLSAKPDMNNQKVVEGADLKLGGEGMKAFYDKIVPNVANDVLKKLGGGRVGEFELDTGVARRLAVAPRDTGMFSIIDLDANVGSAGEYTGSFNTRAEAERALSGMKNGAQPGFDITPELRAKVMAGMPLFSRQGSNLPTAFDRGNIRTDAQAKKDIEALREEIQKVLRAEGSTTVVSTVAFRAVSLPNDNDLQAIAGASGKRVVTVRLDDSQRSVLNWFNGVTRVPGADNVIFIREDSTQPHLAVLGHELVHQLRKDDPALYDSLVSFIRPYVRQSEYSREYIAKHPGMNLDGIREEFIGDIVHDGFMSDRFWDAMGRENPTLLSRIVAAVYRLMRKAAESLGYTPKTARYLSDFDQVMEIAGRAMARYSAGTQVPGEGVKFSRTEANANRSISGALNTIKSSAALNGNLNTLAELFNKASNFNLWDKTVGTQFHKAKKDKDFGRVFNAVNEQVNDVSHYALESEAEAPTILQRMETIRDIGRTFMQGRKSVQNDMKAASKAIFDNIEGVSGVKQKVFTGQELKDNYSLTDNQIELYREFRAAVDSSLDRLSQTLMMKTAGSYMDTRSLKNQSMADTAAEINAGLSKRIGYLREQIEAADSGMSDRREAFKSLQIDPYGNMKQQYVMLSKADNLTDDLVTGAIEKEMADIEAVQERISEMAAFTQELKEKGYSPAMRFGRYAVTVKNGKDIEFFSMYETNTEANIARINLRKEYPGMTVEKSTMNQDAFKMFQGVSPETVELFAKFMGAEEADAFKSYIALARSSRSAMKRMLERKGVAGFSLDMQRVLAQFVVSNARQSAINVNSREINDALFAIPKEKGVEQQEAQKLVEYVRNPIEEAAGLRGFMFMHFMGGSIASAAVNLTQPVMMTTPYLHQFAGSKIASIMADAMQMAATGNVKDSDLYRALRKADADGITKPHEIHMLMAETQGSGSPRWQAFKKAWGGFFSLSEAFNRKTTFLAAYKTAMELGGDLLDKTGFADSYEFAKNAVIETQGLYGKQNRPNWARGAVGATLFTFKQFSIAYIEFFNRLPRKQKMLALGMLVLAAGLEGLPFSDDLEDLIDALGQKMGYATNSKKQIREFMAGFLGDGLAEFALHGVSAIPGVPLDVSARLGLSNLIPGTAVFNPSRVDKGREVLEVFGAAGGLAKGVMETFDTGKVSPAAPVAIKNAFQAFDMWNTGEYRDSRNRKVSDADGLDVLVKSIGFQPAHIAADTRRITAQRRDIDIAKYVESSIAQDWADGILDQNQDKVQSARERLLEWNENNQDMPIKITPQQIAGRVKQARMTRDQRFIKSAPPEMRRNLMLESTQ